MELFNKNYMNKNQKFINEVIDTVAEFEKILEQRRNYDGSNWHCVNVKRYNDGLDLDDLKTIAGKVTKDPAIIQRLATEMQERLENNESYSLYYSWLEQEWDQLNYEIADIVDIGVREKPYKHITLLEEGRGRTNSKHVYSLGRSGGWACFKTDIDGHADEINYILSDILDANNHVIEEDEEELQNRLDDVKMYHEAMKEGMEEIIELKAFIDKFNKSLDFKDEVQFRMEEMLEEIEADEERLQKDQAVHFNAILAKNEIARWLKSYYRDFNQAMKHDIPVKHIQAMLEDIEKYTGELNQPAVKDILESDIKI